MANDRNEAPQAAELSEHVPAEKALRESENRYRLLFDRNPDGVFAVDERGRFIVANAACEAISGYTTQELLEKSVMELCAPDQLAIAVEYFQRCLHQPKYQELETALIRKDGRRIELSVAGDAIVDGGKVVGIYCTAKDISERKHRELELNKLSRTLKALSQSNAAMMRATSEQELLQAVCRIVVEDCAHAMVWIGFKEEDEAKSVRPAAHAGFQEGYLETLHVTWADTERGRGPTGTAIRTGKASQCQDMRTDPNFAPWREQALRRGYASSLVLPLMSDGLAFGAITIYSRQPAAFSEDEVKLLTELANDLAYGITAMRLRAAHANAEAALRRADALLAQAMSVARLGIFEHDHRSGAIEYSPVMRKLTGFGEHEEITVGGILEHVVPEDREALAAAIRQAHDPAGNGQFEIEYRVRLGDGNVRWVSKRAKTFFEGEGSERRPVRTIGAAQDVTERKEIQAGLELLVSERTAKLQELVGELEHFSYTITHDMRAPLRAMRGFGELVNDLCAECQHQERKEFLRRIMTSAARMDCLITDALNYSQSVRQELPVEQVDTGTLLRGMLDSYPELQASKAKISVEGRLPVVLGNEAGMTQCFSNVLSNAVKFAKPGRIPEIRIWAEQRDDWARIWVQDDGIGISKEMLPRVFDMFSRGQTTYEGTGIGLALVRKVTQRMGGKTGVESVEGQGSRFWLELRLPGAEWSRKTPSAREA